MTEHDYKGRWRPLLTVDVVLGWDATTGVVNDALWSSVAEVRVRRRTAGVDARRQPWALDSITGTLLEAIERDLWDAPEETADRLGT